MKREEIIALAGADKFCRTESEGYTHECYEFSIEELERFFHAAQRQAYERAADAVQDSYNSRGKYADDTIRALIEGDLK